MGRPEELPMERDKGQETACTGEPGADRRKTPPSGGREPLPVPVSVFLYRVIGNGGLHGDYARDTQPRVFPQSLYLFVHDGGLHRHIACSPWVHIWLLSGAFLRISIVFLVLLAPSIVCGRAVDLAYHGRLADLGYLPWYLPFLPLIFIYTSTYELAMYLGWLYFRKFDTQNFGPSYRFPILYLCLRAIEYIIQLLPISLLKSL